MSDPTPEPGQDASDILPDELHIALVRPLGVDVADLVEHLRGCLAIYGFGVEVIKLSDFLTDYTDDAPPRSHLYEYYISRMDAGDTLRKAKGGAILALYSIQEVRRRRRAALQAPEEVVRRAYLYDSLMHPDEVAALRQVYEPLLFVISLQSDEAERRNALRQQLIANGSPSAALASLQVDELLNRDRGRGQSSELSFERTFYLGDLFLSGTNPSTLALEQTMPGQWESSDPVLRRFFRQLFSYPFGTPSQEESSMALAFQASRQSAALSRRVGAAIVDGEGQVLALGRNDVPKAGGGLYSADDTKDNRDHNYTFRSQSFPTLASDTQGADSNDLLKLEMLVELFRVALAEGVVSTEFDDASLTSELLKRESITRSQFFQVIAYGRTVHAEMDAISSAVRKGIPIAGATLYCTTLPCHECARHIVAAGIQQVVYVEPYPKSRVRQLHSDAIELSGDPNRRPTDKLLFRPFVGISSLRLDELFSSMKRKHDDPLTPNTYGIATDWIVGPNNQLRSTIVGEEIARSVRSQSTAAMEEAFLEALRIAEGAESEEPVD